MSDSASIDPQALLRETRWLQALVESLVHDDQAAEDVVQSTFLEALTRPPRNAGALRTWLAQVARRLAYRSGDRARWRRRWEEGAARPEAEPSAVDLVSRATIHRLVVEAVLELDEPNRSTILMRYFEDVPPREIAKRYGVPVATVRSRVRRAVEQLRERLDSSTGGREAWLSAIGVPVVPVAAAGVVGGATTGATIMATQTKVLIGAALLLVVGVIGFNAIQPRIEDADETRARRVGTGTGQAATPQPGSSVEPIMQGETLTRPTAPRRIEDVEARSGGRRVTGVVLDDDIGDPLANAEVSIVRNEADSEPVRTLTGVDGRFALPMRGSYWDAMVERLIVAAPDHVRWESGGSPFGPRRAESRVSGRDTDFTVRVERGSVVAGRLVSAVGRDPVAGAFLFLRQDYSLLDPSWGLTPVGATGEDGTFALPERVASSPNRVLFLIAVHPKGVDWVLLTPVKGVDRVSVEILARDGFSVTVRVIDADQRPQQGASVLALPRFLPLGSDGAARSWPPQPQRVPPGSPLFPSVDRFLRGTDSSGLSLFNGLPEGRLDPAVDRVAENAIEFFAFKEGFEPGKALIQSPFGSDVVTIVITPRRARAITGVVRSEAGSPVAGASVEILRQASSTTNDQGEYRLTVPGFYEDGHQVPVVAKAPGFAYLQRAVWVAPGQPDRQVDFVLRPAAAVTGRVVDEGGRPVPRVRVELRRQSDGTVWSCPGDHDGTTREDGTFSFPLADAKEWDLSVMSSKDWEPWRQRTVRGGERIEVVLRRALVGKARVVAEVVDAATGQAVAPAAATIFEAHAQAGDSGLSPKVEVALGRVSAEALTPGEWELMVGALGYAKHNQVFTVGASDEEVRLRVALGRTGVVIAHVVLDEVPIDRRPDQVTIWAPDVRWVTEPGKPSPNASRGAGTATQANGWTCRFEDVTPDAPLRFWLEPWGGFSDEQLLKIGSGETRTIELRPRLAGRVTMSTPAAVTGGIVLLAGDGKGGWYWVASESLERPAVWTHTRLRPAGLFRWRLEVWPLDVSARLRQPRVSEGEAMIEGEKTTTIKVTLPE